MLETQKNNSKPTSPKSQTFILSDIGFTLTDDILHFFGMDGIRYIAEIEASEIFKEMKSLSELHELSDLIVSKTDIPSGFFETLNLIYMLRGPSTLRYFDEQKITRNESECDGEYLCRVFAQDRALFARLSKRVEGRINSDGTSFSVARLKKPALKEKHFFKGKENELEQACRLYYKAEGYTDHCILQLVNINGREGFRVERGSHLSHLAVLENKERLTRHTVLRKVDIVFFDSDTQTLWVYAKGQRYRDIAFYQMIATRVLTGHGEAHENLDLNLSFIRDRDLKRKLDKPREFAERVILRKAFFPQQPDSCVSSPLKTSSVRKECLTDKKDFIYNAERISSFSGAELKIVVNEEDGVFDQITIGSGRIVYGGIVGLDDIFKLLMDLDVIGRAINA